MNRVFHASASLIVLLLIVAPAALGQCVIEGTSVAELNTEYPELGEWKYTITVTWDTGSMHALSHLDVMFGWADHNCVCEDFYQAFAFSDTAGVSTGVLMDDTECTVYYYGEVLCEGDPSIPGSDEPLIKWEPFEPEGDCEPGPTGEGTFWFYTDWDPVPAEIPNEFLVEKDDLNYCYGELTGDIPLIGCDEVPAARSSWGGVKASYR
jgi:hypothetical protein